MAITVRGTSTGPNAPATSNAISLPAGVVAGDVSIICYVQASAAGGPFTTLTQPAGWTVLANASGTLVCWRAFQAGDATTGITATSAISTWWISTCIAYTGLNTASPIDAQGSNFSYADTNAQSSLPSGCRAPSLCPNFMGSRLLCVYSYATNGGLTIGLPAGLTAQVSSNAGPNVRMCDKALVDGTPTGTIDAPVTGARGQIFFGAQIALKAAGAAAATLAPARPQVTGTFNQSLSGNLTLPLAALNVQDGDMVVAALAVGGGLPGVPAGYTPQSTQNGAYIYTRLWSTGDSVAPLFTLAVWNSSAVSLVRTAGVSAGPITFDKIAAAGTTGTGAITTTIATQTPAQAAELLLVAFGTNNSSGGTWSGITGSGLTDEAVTAAGPGLRWSWAFPAAVPTGAYVATFTAGTSQTLGGAAMLLGVTSGGGGGGGGGATVQARAVVMA